MLEKIIESTISQFPPTSGDDLLGFEMDFVALFDDEKFRTAEVSISKNSQSIINIEIEIKESVETIQELTEIIRDLYQKVEYNELSLHGVKWLNKSLEFRFLTMPAKYAYFVTGTVRVTGKEYEALYGSFEKEFRSLIN
jgi:hypothetical protein